MLRRRRVGRVEAGDDEEGGARCPSGDVVAEVGALLEAARVAFVCSTLASTYARRAAEMATTWISRAGKATSVKCELDDKDEVEEMLPGFVGVEMVNCVSAGSSANVNCAN